ncbi:MAG: hypothetical protein LIP02_07410 [Bacteroidales bacterium]|nr:hypothetical protein [Bacteroidales bacterium]
MKKTLLAVLAVMGLVSFTSCSSDDPVASTSGQEVSVTVTASLPSDIQSRTYSDGYTATDFYYAVYEESADGTSESCIITKTKGTSFSGLTTTLSLQLVTGKTYKMVFWAQSPNATDYFTVADDLSTVEVNYEKIEKLNVEDTDAFWCMKEVPVTGAATFTAELKRPFAQINVGTSDIAEKSLAGKTISTQMTVANVFSKYNLLTGDIDSSDTGSSVTFATTIRPNQGKSAGDDGYEDFPVGTSGQYEYLGMAYVLMSKDKLTSDIDLDFYDGEDVTTATRFHHLDVDGAPLQRNYRTNIFGALLTSTIDFTITIKPDYETPDYPETAGDASSLTSTIASLNSTGGTIALSGDISMTTSLTVATVAGATTTIDLAGNTLDFSNDTFIVMAGRGALNIKNGTIKAANDTKAVVKLQGYSTTECTLENVHIIRTVPSGNYSSTGALELGCNDNDNFGTMTVKDCSISSESTAGITMFGNNDITITNTAVSAMDLAISTNASHTYTGNITLTDCTFTADGAALFNQNYTFTIDNCTFNGTARGLIARGGTYTVTNSKFYQRFNGYTRTTSASSGVVEAVAVTTQELNDWFVTEDTWPANVSTASGQSSWKSLKWASGSLVPCAAVILGNRSTAYQYPTVATFTDCVISGNARAVYGWGYSTDNNVTVTYSSTTITGDTAYGDNVTVN